MSQPTPPDLASHNQSVVDQVFLQQAQHLINGGELLPGGELLLAKKLQQAANTGIPLRVKLGLDPTRPDLHLGHTVVLRKLRAFQNLGHKAVLIIGDATALIGDPSGRNHTRPPLTPEEIEVNANTYLAQAGKIIDVDKAEIVRNSQWLSPLNLPDLLTLAAKVTVAQLLVRDDFAKRYAAQQPISLHELLYPLMQGYDSVAVQADVELGGSDQRFNNLMGRELQQAYGLKQAPQLVLLMPLLEGTDGVVKMSKSYPDHCINLTDSPEAMYGKMMSIPDSLLGRYQLLLTSVTPQQIAEQAQKMTLPPDQGGINPRDVKAYLAHWLVQQYYTPEIAKQAETDFIQRFKHKALPDEMPSVSVEANTPYPLVALMVSHGLAPSNAEARRLITGGGVKLTPLAVDGTPQSPQKIDDADYVLSIASTTVLQVGKRRFVKLVVA
jgi:tyrosyl-tRNA synthetase